jgi:hypothetical protein
MPIATPATEFAVKTVIGSAQRNNIVRKLVARDVPSVTYPSLVGKPLIALNPESDSRGG